MTDTIGDVDIEFDESTLGVLNRVVGNQQTMRERILKEQRAWSVDETTQGGAWFLGTVRQLAKRPIVNPRKPPTVALGSAFELSICPRVHEEDPTVFKVPEGAELIKRGNMSYQIVVDDKSICLSFNREGRLKLGRHTGFRKDHQHARRSPSAQAMMRVVYSAS